MPKKTKKNKKCDLHLHSYYSDGVLSPQELVTLALKAKLSCISITDHDCVKAVREVKNESYLVDLELIEGLELTTFYQNSEVHILAYLVNTEDKLFNQVLDQAYQIRQLRFKEMVEKLVLAGISIDKESLVKEVEGIVPTRLHLAKHLLKIKQVNSIYEAFKRYLAPGKIGYICRSRFSSKEAIDFIHYHGGLAFLAHPHKLTRPDWLDDFLSFKIDGIEVAYPTMSDAEQSFFKDYALGNNLLLSGGSDFHQSLGKFRKIGCVDVPYDWVLKMKQRKNEIIALGKG
ncbi:MAG: PHP domain-containing protein [Candidatus Omnitrophica bacterium]|nr:PHP domain-containing protein [Candidatus Omnitrophota bacterium]MCF7893786.1 PHP domain-containing protein [Candidatus Omnitrophota bacterium]